MLVVAVDPGRSGALVALDSLAPEGLRALVTWGERARGSWFLARLRGGPGGPDVVSLRADSSIASPTQLGLSIQRAVRLGQRGPLRLLVEDQFIGVHPRSALSFARREGAFMGGLTLGDVTHTTPLPGPERVLATTWRPEACGLAGNLSREEAKAATPPALPADLVECLRGLMAGEPEEHAIDALGLACWGLGLRRARVVPPKRARTRKGG